MEHQLSLSFFIFFTFLIGFLSDINFLNSPKLRILFQSTVVFVFIYYLKINIDKTEIYLLDIILDNFLLSYFFTTFCLLIVMNGSNFIDGLNGLVLGYYLIVLLIIYKLGLYEKININENNLLFFIFIISLIFLFNVFEYLYIGDSGAYVLGSIVGYILILIYNNQNVSAFYVVLLLWYPCFEILFSIIRKFRLKESPILPDAKHLHQLLFYILNKKLSHSNHYVNNLASFIIILYNSIIFFIASNYITHTKTQIFFIILNIVLYIFFYLKLLAFRNKMYIKLNN